MCKFVAKRINRVVPAVLVFLRFLARQVFGILMDSLAKGGLHAGGERYDAILAVFFADFIHGGEGPAPVLSARLVNEAGLAFGGLERLRVHSQQPDGFTSPVLMKELARRSRQFRIDLRCVVERSGSRKRRKVGVEQLDLQGPRKHMI